jgi:hypothetical protein
MDSPIGLTFLSGNCLVSVIEGDGEVFWYDIRVPINNFLNCDYVLSMIFKLLRYSSFESLT